MMANRPIRYQIHIRPLFSAMDREHMSFFIDLWDTSAFYTADGKPKMDIINKIYEHVGPGGDMPPVTHGGLWPQEWQNLYRRWIDEGCQKLELGKGTYSARRLGDVLLSAQNVTVPEGSQLWLERDNACAADYTYNLYIEAPITPTGKTEIKSTTEDVGEVPDNIKTIVILSSDGPQTVTIT